MKKHKWPYLIITLIVISIAGQIGKESANEFFPVHNRTQQTSLKRYYIEYMNLSILSPGELTEYELNMPNNITQMISTYKVYEFTSNSLAVKIASFTYKSGIVINLDGSYNGAINEMSKAEGVSNFTVSKNYTKCFGRDSIIYTGSLKIEDEQTYTKGQIIADTVNNRLLMIQIFYYNFENSIATQIQESVILD